MAVRLVLLAVVAALSGCAHVETRATTPVPVPLAREMRAGSQDRAVARVFVLVAGEHRSERQDGPRLEAGGHALVAVHRGRATAGAEPWTWVEAGEALVVDVAPGPITVRTLPSWFADVARDGRQMSLTVAAGEAVFLAVASAPSPSTSHTPVEVARLDDDAGRAMVLSRALVRTSIDEAGLTRPAAPRAVVDARAADVVRAGRLAVGAGRLLVLAGGFIDERQGTSAADRTIAATIPAVRAHTLSLVIEGQPIASFLRDEMLALDLPPGTYAMLWQAPFLGGTSVERVAWNEVPRTVQVAEGATTILSADIIDLSRRHVPDGPEMTFGLLSGFRTQPKRWDQRLYTFLRPAPPPARGDGAAQVVFPAPSTLALIPGARRPVD